MKTGMFLQSNGIHGPGLSSCMVCESELTKELALTHADKKGVSGRCFRFLWPIIQRPWLSHPTHEASDTVGCKGCIPPGNTLSSRDHMVRTDVTPAPPFSSTHTYVAASWDQWGKAPVSVCSL